MLSVLPTVENFAEQGSPEPKQDVDEFPSDSFSAADRLRIRRSIIGGAVAGFLPYVCVLWDFRLNPLRRAGAHGFASNFYDLQARAVLDGHCGCRISRSASRGSSSTTTLTCTSRRSRHCSASQSCC